MTRSPRELAAQRAQLRKDQERLFQDLLGILDALDHACEHWQQAEQAHATAPSPSLRARRRRSWWWRLTHGLRRLTHGLRRLTHGLWRRPKGLPAAARPVQPDAVDAMAMAEVLSSAHEGVELIRRSLLELLSQHQVRPLQALGQPFDPTTMYAVARQASEGAPANTVVQEVVRGYLWQDRILREAQVIVAAASELPDDEVDDDPWTSSSGRGRAQT